MTIKEFYNLNYDELTKVLSKRGFIIIRDEINQYFRVYMEIGRDLSLRLMSFTKNFEFITYPSNNMVQMNVPYNSYYAKKIKYDYAVFIIEP